MDTFFWTIIALSIWLKAVIQHKYLEAMLTTVRTLGCRPSMVVRLSCAGFPSNDRLANPAFGPAMALDMVNPGNILHDQKIFGIQMLLSDQLKYRFRL